MKGCGWGKSLVLRDFSRYLRAFGRLCVGSKELPIGDAYRERLKASLSGLTLL